MLLGSVLVTRKRFISEEWIGGGFLTIALVCRNARCNTCSSSLNVESLMLPLGISSCRVYWYDLVRCFLICLPEVAVSEGSRASGKPIDFAGLTQEKAIWLNRDGGGKQLIETSCKPKKPKWDWEKLWSVEFGQLSRALSILSTFSATGKYF